MRQKISWRDANDYQLPNPLAKLGDSLGINRVRLAAELDLNSSSTLNNYVAPLDHPNFTIPPSDVLRRIFIWSGGILTPDSFHPVKRWREDMTASVNFNARARGDIEALS